MNEKQLLDKLKAVIEFSKKSKSYCKQTMIKSHKNVCIYGLGKFFRDVFEDVKIQDIFEINYLSDADSEKWGKTYYGIKCIKPEELKNIDDLIVIILVGGDITQIEKQFLDWNITYIPGYELLIETSLALGSGISEDYFNENQILDVFNSINSLQSKEIYVEVLTNRLAPQLRNKAYKDLVFSKDYFDRSCYDITDNESLVDCGAFNGDTVCDFLNNVNNFDNIYSFEMDINNYKALLSYVETLNYEQKAKINCYHMGVWSEKSIVSYGNEGVSPNEAYSIFKSVNCNEVMVDKLDNILKDKKVTFIKMDIEGSELKALMGAEEIIRKQKPKLAICIYHKLEDFWQIPMYIKSIVPEYTFEVRHHITTTYGGTVLYAHI